MRLAGCVSLDAAAGIAALVNVAFNTVTAGIGNPDKANPAETVAKSTGGSIRINADSDRTIDAIAVNLAAGANAGVGITLTATVAGGKLDTDASKALYGKGSTANGQQKGFAPEATILDV